MRGMMTWAVLALAVLCSAAPARADTPGQRMITRDEAANWRGLGRLNVAGNRYCTATLVAPDQVITSAHCLFHPVTRHQADPKEIRFVPGMRLDDHVAILRVARVVLMPGYAYPGPVVDADTAPIDMALLILDRPMTDEEAAPLAVRPFIPGPGSYDIAGYGRDRPLIPSLREGCNFIGAEGAFMALDCSVVPGLSGAPVVLSGGQEVVGLVSASIGTRVQGVGVVILPVEPHLSVLRALLQ